MSTNPSLSTILSAWTFEPQILLGLVLLAAVYVSGLRDLARRGRLQTISRWHIGSFASGLLALLLALESLLDTFDTRLVAIHMAQHLLHRAALLVGDGGAAARARPRAPRLAPAIYRGDRAAQYGARCALHRRGHALVPVLHRGPTPVGLSVLDDQRLAGLIMWVPGDMMHRAAAAVPFFALLVHPDQAGTLRQT